MRRSSSYYEPKLKFLLQNSMPNIRRILNKIRFPSAGHSATTTLLARKARSVTKEEEKKIEVPVL